MSERGAKSRCGKEPGADVGKHLESRCRCGSGEPSPGADDAGVSPVPAQMQQA